MKITDIFKNDCIISRFMIMGISGCDILNDFNNPGIFAWVGVKLLA